MRLMKLAALTIVVVGFTSCKKVIDVIKPDKPGVKTVTLQPANNPTEVHLLSNDSRDASGVGVQEIGAVSWTDGAVIGMRGLLKFDLSKIRNNAVIEKAFLSLYSHPKPLNGNQNYRGPIANDGNNNAFLVQRVVDDWNPATANWHNKPAGTTEDQILVPHTNEFFLDILDLDVTEQVKKMHVGRNNGFLLRLQTEEIYNSRIFVSSNYANYDNVNRHPKLVIQYK